MQVLTWRYGPREPSTHCASVPGPMQPHASMLGPMPGPTMTCASCQGMG